MIELADIEKVNNIEKPYFGRPDVIPPIWDAEHVGVRIIDALKTDARMPRPRGPKEPGGNWPAYTHEFADWVGMTPMEKAERITDQNNRMARLPPTAEEVSQRDQVLDWFLIVKNRNEKWFPKLMSWANASYRNINHEDMCSAKKWPVRTYWYHIERAKGFLAQWLNDRNVKPW